MPTTFAAKANVRVLTDDGRDVVPGSGEDGVLAVAGRLPLGYHHDPDATARMFREVDGVRYAMPGDRARVLVDGRIELLGRGSACINTGGEKVYPEEVEQVLRQHPRWSTPPSSVCPTPRWGEMVTALVELVPDTMLDTALDETLPSTPVPSSPDTRCRSDSSPSRSCRAPSPASPTTRVCGRWRPDRERGRSGAIDSRAGTVGGGPLRRCRSGGGRRDPPHVPRAGGLGAPGDPGRDGAGIRPGDRVGIWAPNSWEWIVAALGTLGAGAWLVPVNTRFKGDEAAYVLDRADVALLFTVRGFLDTDYVAMLRQAAPHLRCLDHVVFLAGSLTGEHTFDDYLATGDAVDAADADARIAALGPDDVADVIFTSGTTGRSEGSDARPRCVAPRLRRVGPCFGFREGDRYLIVNPFFHCFGYKAGWMACLRRARPRCPMPAFDARPAARARERGAHLGDARGRQPSSRHCSTPDDGDADLSSLRVGFIGASTVPPELFRRMRAELPFESLTTGYGLTECTAMVSVTRPDDEPEHVAHWDGGCPRRGHDEVGRSPTTARFSSAGST